MGVAADVVAKLTLEHGRTRRPSCTCGGGPFPPRRVAVASNSPASTECVAFWRKRDENSRCRAGPVGRDFKVSRGGGRGRDVVAARADQGFGQVPDDLSPAHTRDRHPLMATADGYSLSLTVLNVRREMTCT